MLLAAILVIGDEDDDDDDDHDDDRHVHLCPFPAKALTNTIFLSHASALHVQTPSSPRHDLDPECEHATGVCDQHIPFCRSLIRWNAKTSSAAHG